MGILKLLSRNPSIQPCSKNFLLGFLGLHSFSVDIYVRALGYFWMDGVEWLVREWVVEDLNPLFGNFFSNGVVWLRMVTQITPYHSNSNFLTLQFGRFWMEWNVNHFMFFVIHSTPLVTIVTSKQWVGSPSVPSLKLPNNRVVYFYLSTPLLTTPLHLLQNSQT